MSDIVEEMRREDIEHGSGLVWAAGNSLYMRAVHEIERLRTQTAEQKIALENYDTQFAALTAQVEQAAWQPIETAPISKRFLAYVPIDNIRLFIAMKTREGLLLDEQMQPMHFPATHWMPLPTPPRLTSTQSHKD